VSDLNKFTYNVIASNSEAIQKGRLLRANALAMTTFF